MISHKLAKIISLVLAVVSVVLFFIVQAVEITKTSDNQGIVTAYIVLSYIAFAIAIIAVIYYIVKQTMQDKAGLKKTFISVGLMALAFIVGLILADGNEVVKKDVVVASAGVSKMIGAFLNMFYFIALAAIASLVWANIPKFKK